MALMILTLLFNKGKIMTRNDTKNKKNSLFIKVYKNNALYLSEKFSLNSLFTKNITLGSHEKNSLHLVDDSISIPKKITLFRIRKNKAELILDNRISGKITKNDKIKNIEFLSPIDHRNKAQKTPHKKAVENLDLSSSGELRVNNFRISFSISSDSKDFVSKSKGLAFSFFHLPSHNIPFEIHAFWIALFSTTLMFCSFIYWLSKES